MAGELIHVGFGNYVSADQMIGVASPAAAPIKRMVRVGRKDQLTIDMTSGKRTKSVLFMANGSIVLSAITPRAIAGRATRGPSEDE
jgi:extracellular matrix regulatory protein A